MERELRKRCRIMLGDSLDLMGRMRSACVDGVVTDPPFGIGKKYGGVREAANTPEGYWTWFRPYFEEMLRVLRPGGLMAIWQAQKNFRHFWDWYGDSIHIYAACRNFIQIYKTPIQTAYDPVVMFYKAGAVPLRPAKPKRSLDFFVANTAYWVARTGALEKQHPYPRPLDQAIALIDNFTLPGGTIFDPFGGSGTMALACAWTSRKFLMFEIVPDYVELSKERLRRFWRDGRLEGIDE